MTIQYGSAATESSVCYGQLREKGLTLYFLPPYSPELNRIEKLWHKMKYEWMAFKARNSAGLEADVDKILDGFGSHYRMTFC
jgi:transposase